MCSVCVSVVCVCGWMGRCVCSSFFHVICCVWVCVCDVCVGGWVGVCACSSFFVVCVF